MKKSDAGVIFTETMRVAAVWFIHASELAWATKGGLCDILAVVYQEPAGAEWQFVYRFRYGTRGSDPHSDRKSWYRATGPVSTTEEDLVEATRQIIRAIAEATPGELDEIIVGGNGARALELMSAYPWCRMEKVEKR